MTLDDAISLESRDRLVEAAAAYDRLLDQPEPSIETWLNALVLYWQATDLGLAAGMKLPKDFMARAGDRLEWIKDDERLQRLELGKAWLTYIDCLEGGESWQHLCALLDSLDGKASGELAFFVFYLTDGSKMRDEVRSLRESLQKAPRTMRNRYLSSVIDSIMQHH